LWTFFVFSGAPGWSDSFSAAKTALLRTRTLGACQPKRIPRGWRKSEGRKSSRWGKKCGHFCPILGDLGPRSRRSNLWSAREPARCELPACIVHGATQQACVLPASSARAAVQRRHRGGRWRGGCRCCCCCSPSCEHASLATHRPCCGAHNNLISPRPCGPCCGAARRGGWSTGDSLAFTTPYTRPPLCGGGGAGGRVSNCASGSRADGRGRL